MSIKKISGYTIFLKEILGKGSYGSVGYVSRRYIKESKMERKCRAPLKCLIRKTVRFHLTQLIPIST